MYINKNITESLYHNLKKNFQKYPSIDKFILIDNGNAAKHRELFSVFEEVYFYERFRRNKIVEVVQQVRSNVQKIVEKKDDDENFDD